MQLSGRTALSDALALFTSRFVSMLIIAVIYFVAVIVLFLVFGAGMFAQMSAAMMGGGGAPPNLAAMGGGFLGTVFLLYLVMYSLQFAEQAALCHLCSDRQEPSIGDSIGVGVRSVPTLLGVAVLLIIAMIVVSLVVGLVVGGAAAASGSSAVSLILSLVMLVCAAAIMTKLSMILPIVAIDGERNPITAIGSSWRMTSGSTFKLFLVLVAAVVVLGVVAIAIFMLTIGVPRPDNLPSGGGMIAFFVLIVVFAVSAGNYFVALIAAIHRQLSGGTTAAVTEAFA